MPPPKTGPHVFAGYARPIIFFLALLAPNLTLALDHSLFGELLKNHVKNGVVDYRGFKKDIHRLDQYLDLLGSIDPQDLDRQEQFAFYINAYNAATIRLIIEKFPDIESIWDLGGRVFNNPFRKKFIQLGNQTVSLDHIENDILRPRFGDPRVHFAINCASKSCPPLQSTPYSRETLENQLDAVTRAFINDTRFNHLKGNVLHVSRIFKWFQKDFDNDPYEFIFKYAMGDLKKRLVSQKENIRIKYLDYDWSLNGK
jgi:hypothetical protein